MDSSFNLCNLAFIHTKYNHLYMLAIINMQFIYILAW